MILLFENTKKPNPQKIFQYGYFQSFGLAPALDAVRDAITFTLHIAQSRSLDLDIVQRKSFSVER